MNLVEEVDGLVQIADDVIDNGMQCEQEYRWRDTLWKCL